MNITLCGSTRFMEQFHAWNRWLTLQGHAVYSVSVSMKDGDIPTESEKEILDLVHFLKIDNSDSIVVIDCLRLADEWRWNKPDRETDEWKSIVKRYVGYSTEREMAWAQMKEKHTFYTCNHIEHHLSRGFSHRTT